MSESGPISDTQLRGRHGGSYSEAAVRGWSLGGLGFVAPVEEPSTASQPTTVALPDTLEIDVITFYICTLIDVRNASLAQS
jgi:hypothetical protein